MIFVQLIQMNSQQTKGFPELTNQPLSTLQHQNYQQMLGNQGYMPPQQYAIPPAPGIQLNPMNMQQLNPMIQGNIYMTPQRYPYQQNSFNTSPAVVVPRVPGVAIEFGANGLYCPVCLRTTPTLATKSPGFLTYLSCAVLFFFTGFLLFWLPFCIDDCQDTKMLCTICRMPKSRIRATEFL